MNFRLDYFDIMNTVKYNIDIPNMFVRYMRVLAMEDMQEEDLLLWDLCHVVIFCGEVRGPLIVESHEYFFPPQIWSKL